jgi:elongator complex protein 3
MTRQYRTGLHMNHGKITLVFYNKPTPCGGSCRFCILDPGFTKSTVRNEDTLMARNCSWDPTCQMEARFRQYSLQKGNGSKYGLAVKGDSFTNHDKTYMRQYFKALYDYLNGRQSIDLAEARSLQASAPDRCVWTQIETRPDQITDEWCETFLELGVNSVELGVQCIDDEVLKINRRGHGTDAVRDATSLLRAKGFEVGYHMMVGLPGSSDELDYEVLTHRLWEPELSPDGIKIYPCILMKNRKLQPQLVQLLNKGVWNPLTDERYFKLLSAAFPQIPSTVRVNRIQRLIPPQDIDLGPSKVIDRRVFAGVNHCLWQRSAARTMGESDDPGSYVISLRRHGTGYCVEATLRGGAVLLGYGRLNVVERGIGMIRDLRVLGDMVPIGNQSERSLQHRGIGEAILRKLEDVTLANGCSSLRVHSPSGSVNYFLRRGFRSAGPDYLLKVLTSGPGKVVD